jgi:hypothetical protein
VKRIHIIIVTAGLLAACSRSPQANAPAQKAEAPEPLKATVWTGKGELYLEYPALVSNQESRFAIHLTRPAISRPSKTPRVKCILPAKQF